MTKIYLTSLVGQDVFCHPIKSNLILVSKSFKPTYDESHEVTLNFQIYLEAALVTLPVEMVKFNHQDKNHIDLTMKKLTVRHQIQSL
jgi:hypothetical protein